MRRVRGWVGVGAAVAAAATSSCSFGMPDARSTEGRDTFDLWQVFFIASIFVAGIVYGLIVWCVVRYRRRRFDAADVRGAAFEQHLPLELLYTAIPIALVAVLFGLSVRTQSRVTEVVPDPDLVVRVQAFTWGWRFDYVDQGVQVVSEPSGEGVPGPTLVLPVGETTRIELTSTDVVHAMWVPDFLFKRDAIPGRTNRFDLTPDRTGTYLGECSEFCGLLHAYMRFSVRVVEASEFDAWISRHRAAA